MLARIRKTIRSKVAEEHRARTKMQIHIWAILFCGLITYILGLFHVADTNAIIASFGPFTPTMIQEALDYLKGL